MKCPNCGNEIADNVSFCPNCGTKVQDQQNQQNQQSSPYGQQSYNNNNYNYNGNYNGYNQYSRQPLNIAGIQLTETQLTIWSVISLLCCCFPLGVAGLIVSLTAKNLPTQEAYSSRLRIAAILNLIALAIGVFSIFITMAISLLD